MFINISLGVIIPCSYSACADPPCTWPQIACYAVVGNTYSSMLATGVFGGIFSALASNCYGRSLLLAYPGLFSNGIFSHEGKVKWGDKWVSGRTDDC